MNYSIVEVVGKTRFIYKDEKKNLKSVLTLFLIIFLITLYFSILYLDNVNFFLFVIPIGIFEFISIYYYYFKFLDSNNILIDPTSQSLILNYRETISLEAVTKIIQFYQIIKGKNVDGSLVFVLNEKEDIGSFGNGFFNYVFGKKLAETLKIPYSSEIRYELRKSSFSLVAIYLILTFLLLLIFALINN